jgi:hypothetical protein
MRRKSDWLAWVFWAIFAAVPLAALLVLARLPEASRHYHDAPSVNDLNRATVGLGALILMCLMFYGWIAWSQRHPRD